MRIVGALLSVALSAAVLFPVARPSRAGDDSAASELYRKGEEGLGRRAGAALWQAAESARKAGLHGFAYEAAQRVLEFDPDHKRARKHLGFVRRRGEWEIDPDEAKDVPSENQRPKRMSDEQFAEKQRAWREGDLAEALAEIADLYADLGGRCDAEGFAVEARKAWERALALDPDCTKAREGLGYLRVGEAWMTPAQKAAREAASVPEPFEEESRLDGVLGTKLTKMRSANVIAESVFDAGRTASLVSALETAYTYYLTDIGRDPNERVLRSPVRACFVRDEGQWSSWLRDQAPDRADFYRPHHYYRHSGRLLVAVRESDTDGAYAMEDNATHAFVHVLNDVVWRLRAHPWLDEGLAYYYTLKVRGTTESWCVEPDLGRYGNDGGADADEKVSEAVWRAHVKDLVRRGDDMDLRMLASRPLNELKLSETVKGWSVATWLMDTDRDGAVRLFAAIGKSSSGAEALEAHFGRSVEETDDAWRAWVRRTH